MLFIMLLNHTTLTFCFSNHFIHTLTNQTILTPFFQLIYTGQYDDGMCLVYFWKAITLEIFLLDAEVHVVKESEFC